MGPVERFAEEASAYEQWALRATDSGAAAAREGLVRVLALYSAALALPELAFPDGEERAGDRVDDAEWKRVTRATSRLPFDAYGEDAHDGTPGAADHLAGSLCDDLAEIYRDVVSALRTYRAGGRLEAVWHWRFDLQAHWGAHAVSAIRALHGWLVQDGSLLDRRLSMDRP